MRKILPSVTTHGCSGHTWREKLLEISGLGLKEVALFTTGLSPELRQQCFKLLTEIRASQFFTIPFVHAVSSMTENEYWFLKDTFGTEFFNLHPTREYPLEHTLSKNIRNHILIENSTFDIPLSVEDVNSFAGVCFDVSHLEDTRRTSHEEYLINLSVLNNYKVAANHISAVFPKPVQFTAGRPGYSKHVFETLSDFDYLKNLPSAVFSNLCAIELENSLAEQVALVPLIRSLIEPEVVEVSRIAA